MVISEEWNFPVEKIERKIVIATPIDRIVLVVHQGKIRTEQKILPELKMPEMILPPVLPVKKGFWQSRKEEKQLEKDLKLAEKKARLQELNEKNKLKNIYNDNEI